MIRPDLGASPAAIAAFRRGILAWASRRGLNRAEAEDLAQTTICRALERRESYTEGSLFGWLLAIARNALIDEIRMSKRRRSRELAVFGGAVAPGTPETTCYASEVFGALGRIPAQRASAVTLSAIGWGNQEIAAKTGVSVNVVGQRLCRGRADIRALTQ